jgi:hypothetical protein
MPTQSDRNGFAPASVSLQSNSSFADLLNAHERARAFGRPLLTAAGIGFIRQRLLGIGRRCLLPLARAARSQHGREPLPLPSWDAQTRRLWLGNRLLKEFRQPAPHQTRLLDVFEKQGWLHGHIADPLFAREHESEQDAKRRLHETLKNLNRALPARTIRFRGDGTGQGIFWEYDRPDS